MRITSACSDQLTSDLSLRYCCLCGTKKFNIKGFLRSPSVDSNLKIKKTFISCGVLLNGKWKTKQMWCLTRLFHEWKRLAYHGIRNLLKQQHLEEISILEVWKRGIFWSLCFPWRLGGKNSRWFYKFILSQTRVSKFG